MDLSERSLDPLVLTKPASKLGKITPITENKDHKSFLEVI